MEFINDSTTRSLFKRVQVFTNASSFEKADSLRFIGPFLKGCNTSLRSTEYLLSACIHRSSIEPTVKDTDSWYTSMLTCLPVGYWFTVHDQSYSTVALVLHYP